MAERHPAFRGLQKLAQRLSGAEAKADALRDELYRAVAAAYDDGMKIQEVADALEVSRQRAQQLLRRLEKR